MSMTPHSSPAQTIAIGLAEAISGMAIERQVYRPKAGLLRVAIHEFEQVVLSRQLMALRGNKKRGLLTPRFSIQIVARPDHGHHQITGESSQASRMPSVNARSLREREGWRSLRNALASIWRMRSRVTANDCPTFSRVCSEPSSRPKRILMTFSSRGVSVRST